MTLDFGGKNFAICGPNGTGKSGIVDALEFVLTGNISRLSGAGTGGLSVKDHGPHVDSRDKPDNAIVTLTVEILSLDKEVTLTRSIKEANKLQISPDSPEVRKVLDNVSLHPEFTLSRRQLIKYVLSEPGKRAKDVQDLLRLEDVEAVRTLLQRIANASERDVKSLGTTFDQASAALKSALGLTKLGTTEVLGAANAKRAVLSLPALTVLAISTSIKDGLVAAGEAGTPVRISKSQAQEDIKQLRDALVALSQAELLTQIGTASSQAELLLKDEAFLQAASRESLLASALALFEDEVCPVCDTPWKPDDFRQRIAHKMEHLTSIANKRKALQAILVPIQEALERARTATGAIVSLATDLRPSIVATEIQAFRDVLSERHQQIERLLPIKSTVAALAVATEVPLNVIATLSQVETAVTSIPEPSQLDACRDFLVVGQEKLESYRRAQFDLGVAQDKAKTVRFVCDHYGQTTTAALESIYDQVETFFSKLYRLVNADDEKDFEAHLRPSTGKLGLDVDFYQRGFFPPGAYHSEGHQDGMGLCLYLALMNHLAGSSFTFAVLDDVLMSVDSGHRREVSRMLQEQFPNTQFILTTHDEIWLRHMKTVGLIESKQFVYFRTWDVSVGPSRWDNEDTWERIAADLKKVDVRSAAALLRNYLEHFSKEACQALRAAVEYKGDAQYTLNDLLPSAVARFAKCLRAAKTSAVSWKDHTLIQTITAQEADFEQRAKAAMGDQWQMNAVIHFNEWENLTPGDFKPVVQAFQTLVAALTCQVCHDLFHPLPQFGNAESLRCRCGKTNFNLAKKI